MINTNKFLFICLFLLVSTQMLGQPVSDLTLDAQLSPFVFTDSTYTTFSGNGISIINSLPKGGSLAPDGSQYADTEGRRYAFANFWTQIQNNTSQIFDVKLDFQKARFPIFHTPGSYLMLFIPEEEVNLDDLSLFNYGLKDIENKLDKHFNHPVKRQYQLLPGDSVTFYIATLSFNAAGTPRAQLLMNGNALFYEVNFAPHGGGFIPCGSMEIVE